MNPSSRSYDDAVVGAGIIGLAVARELANRGRRVIVFERHPRAMGASVRNFGTLWAIGQPEGPTRRMAIRSLQVWRSLFDEAGIWNAPLGSIHLAYHEDEAQVLDEFAGLAPEQGIECRVLGPAEALKLSPAARRDGLRSALFSPTEICVNPREVLHRLPAYLHETLGLHFAYDHAVVGYDGTYVRAGGFDWRANRLWVCSGDELGVLYPEAFASLGIRKCKLQMMRSAPLAGDFRIGPIVAGGLTLRHYPSFEGCPSLLALRERITRDHPEFERFGVHVLVAQNGRGEVVLGDSHEYDEAIEPYDKAEIDGLILAYLNTLLDIPGLTIASRWSGIYTRHPSRPHFRIDPAPGVVALGVTNGIGMTLSFGLAEQAVRDTLGED